jgi:hypothetical protein
VIRRVTLLAVAAAVAAPLLAAAPAEASVYCGRLGPVEQAFGPLCTVKCALANPPVVDPTRTVPVYLPGASCYYED